MEVFPIRGTLESSILMGTFHDKQSVLGYPHLSNLPSVPQGFLWPSRRSDLQDVRFLNEEEVDPNFRPETGDLVARHGDMVKLCVFAIQYDEIGTYVTCIYI